MSRTSSRRTFGGANIKGTPPMSARAVRSDLRKLRQRLDIIALQEFRHPWYWTVLGSVLGGAWHTFPSLKVGRKQPVYGGQGVLWKRRLASRVTAVVMPAFDFAEDNAGIMENRWIRGVLLEDLVSKLCCWYVSTHFVVGGDEAGDGPRRKAFMLQNLSRLDQVLSHCRRSGEPIVLELDANIHRNSWAYVLLLDLVAKHHGRIVGEHGVEYLAVFDGLHTDVVVDHHYALHPRDLGLNTDHEVRCLVHHLKQKKAP